MSMSQPSATKDEHWESFYKRLQAADAKCAATEASKRAESTATSIPKTEDPVGDADTDVTAAEKSYINKLICSKLVETKECDIELLRSDPCSPLHSVHTFQELNLDPLLLKGIAALGYYQPSAIQEKALPNLIGDQKRNMIAQSQSGTGKTAAFLLAMLSSVEPSLKKCQCICMAPTRELAKQITDVARRMAHFIDHITITAAVPGEIPPVDEEGFVSSQIVIGTPGTLFRWVKVVGQYRIDPSLIHMYVLDEADIMMEEEGFLNISLRIRQKLPSNCQILLFSATYEEKVIDFARTIVPDAIEIRVRRNQLTLSNIRQFYLLQSTVEDKYNSLTEIYGSFDVGQAIIFCRTRREAKWLMKKMVEDGHKVALLSGELDVKEREEVTLRFRNADFRALVTTNVCSRGLDVAQVNLVINWCLPLTRSGKADYETYLHRIGRSGRFGKDGLAINFVDEKDQIILQQLEDYFDISIPLLTAESVSSP